MIFKRLATWSSTALVLTLSCKSALAEGCLPVPYSPGSLEASRPTCIDLTELDRRLSFREFDFADARFGRTLIEAIPYGSTVADLLDQITGYDQDGRLSSVLASQELTRVLERFRNAVTFEVDPKRPETIHRTTEITLEAYAQLGELLAQRKFGPRDRKAIRAEMERFRNLGSLLVSNAMVELITTESKSRRQALIQMFESLDTKFERAIVDLRRDFQEGSGEIEELRRQILALKEKLQTVTDEKEREALERELDRRREARARELQVSIRVVDDYSQFALGITAVYSLFQPEKAARLDGAIRGISTISRTLLELQKPGEALGAAALGHYGVLAMGSVQLISAFSNPDDSQNRAFEAIFQQLQQISRQIDRLQQEMNSQFSAMRSDRLAMERNILTVLGRIHSEIRSIDQLGRASFNLLLSIDENLKQLQGYLANRDVTTRLESAYLSHVQHCLGKDRVSFSASRSEARECFDAISRFATNDIDSSLLTRRSLPGQYRNRGNLSYQINDLLDHYRAESTTSGPLPKELPNPELLADVERSLNLMKRGYFSKLFGPKIDESIFDRLRARKVELQSFLQKFRLDTSYVEKLITGHESRLQQVWSQVAEALSQSQSETAKTYHVSALRRFLEVLENELVYRESDLELQPLQEKGSSARVHLYDRLFVRSEIERMAFLIRSHLKDDTPGQVFFAPHCRAGADDAVDIQLPIPSRVLREKLGDGLHERMLQNPQSVSLCFDLETRTNEVLGRFFERGYWAQPELRRFEAVRNSFVSNIHDPSSGIVVENCRRTGNYDWERTCDIVYRGRVITGLSLRGSFEGKQILNESRAMYERLPLYRGATDRFAVLAIFMGVGFPKGYPFVESPTSRIELKRLHSDASLPVQKPIQGISGVFSFSDRIDYFVADRFSGMRSDEAVVHMRKTLNQLDQGELAKMDRRLEREAVVKRFESALERVDTTALDESGRMLNLALFFRGPGTYASDYADRMNEVWGLRSGRFLKQHLVDVLAAEGTRKGIEEVRVGQAILLRSIRSRVTEVPLVDRDLEGASFPR